MKLSTDAAVVVLSGGQDSATCLLLAVREYKRVHAISFDYGQRHARELVRAAKLAQRFDVPHVAMPMDVLYHIGAGALVDHEQPVSENGGHADLPTTFVPGRNILFLSAAAAYAIKVNARDVVTGVCETDFSGYPDCRSSTIAALETAIQLGTDTDARIVTPLMKVSKADTWALAASAHPDGEAIIRDETLTCYHGDTTQHHPWGYGCGKCPACELRSKGWAEWKGRSA